MELIKTEKINIADLVMDYNVYPRHEIDRVRVNEYYLSLQAGARFPPIRIDSQTNKIADGFHRTGMFKRAKIDEIEAEFYEFEDEAEMIWWSINWNAQHGLKLTKYDQSRCLNIGREFGLSDERVAQALCMTVDKIYGMEKDRIRINTDTGRPVEVKKVLANITSTTVTQRQIDAQKPFNAMRADYSVLRAIDSFEQNLLPINESNIAAAKRLNAACREWLDLNDLKNVN